MSITENIERIEQGKTNIISSIKSKGVNVPNNILINEIAPYINEIQGGGGIVPDDPNNPENNLFQEDFLWIENVDDTDGTVILRLDNAPYIYYSYNTDTDFQKMVNTKVLSIPAHSKIYLRWKGKIPTNSIYGFIADSTCRHNIGGELKNGGLKSNVYEYLFNYDIRLKDASELKLTATTLADYCYYFMFYNCNSLTTAPTILPATSLTENCYSNMFYNCTNLATAPTLPATTLASYCYSYMFNDCTSLTQAPELPATKLASYCYQGMFYGCTSLTTAPELPATALSSYCYNYMFNGCTSLNYIKTNAISWSTSNASSWLGRVASSGVVDVLPSSTITENSTSGVPSGWSKQIDTSAKNIINIHNVSGLENTISIPNKFFAFKYKTNNDAEYNENPTTTALTITLQPDEILIIDGIRTLITSSFNGITSTENIKVYGEVNYLNNFYSLFRNSTKLIDASELKLTVTKLVGSCYNNMFEGCTSLISTPELPATTLGDYCYNGMFKGCTSLTQAPSLPATTLAEWCYGAMFEGCTSLTQAPELPATKLAVGCYYNMFGNCSKLNSITIQSTKPFIYNDSNTIYNWVQNVSSTGTFRTPIENKEWIEDYPRGTSAVPSGWTIEFIE